MKIIRTANNGCSGEEPGNDESVIAENVSEKYGVMITVFLQNREGRPDRDWYKVVEDDYKLAVFTP